MDSDPLQLIGVNMNSGSFEPSQRAPGDPAARAAKRQRTDSSPPTQVDRILSNSSENQEAYEICFGSAIKITTKEFLINLGVSIPDSRKVRKVHFDANADLVVLRDPSTSQYLGMLKYGSGIAGAIATLSNTLPTNITASGLLRQNEGQIDIQIYGLRSDGATVGEILSARNIFLQEPDQASAPYLNPQGLSHLHGAPDSLSDNAKLWQMESTTLSPAIAAQLYNAFDSAEVTATFDEVDVNDKLLTSLKRHQKLALAMMAERESGNLLTPQFPALWVEEDHGEGTRIFRNTVSKATQLDRPRICLGGLLADEMGLGKTLTMLALIVGTGTDQSVLRPLPRASRSTLIVAPLSTLGSWEDEIRTHIKPGLISYAVYHGAKRHLIQISSCSVVLTTYDTLKADKQNSKASNGSSNSLHHVFWHRVVLDEAHIIRNRHNRIFKIACALKAQHRWCLTGTPIQNSLGDFGALLQFLGVHPFDTPSGFAKLLPTNGKDGNTTGWRKLTSLFRAVALRRTKASVLNELGLPKRTILFHTVELNERESELYQKLKQAYVLGSGADGAPMTCFQIILRLRQVCGHGPELLPREIRQWLHSDDPAGVPIPQVCELCEGRMKIGNQNSARNEPVSSCLHLVCETCRAVPRSSIEPQDARFGLGCPLCLGLTISEKSTKPAPCANTQPGSYTPSSKVVALLENLNRNLREPSSLQPKSMFSIVFSCWTRMLDLIGLALDAHGIAYQRIDGSKSFKQRCDAIAAFRDGASYPVLLASLGSAALGLNLTAANEVHLMEPGWNPMLERQALDRVYRLGQQRPVRAIYYIVQRYDSVDENQNMKYILRRQEQKIQLSCLSFGDVDSNTTSKNGLDILQTIGKHLLEADLRNYCGGGRSENDAIIVE